VVVSLVQGFVTQQASVGTTARRTATEAVGHPLPETYRRTVVDLFDAAGLGPDHPDR